MYNKSKTNKKIRKYLTEEEVEKLCDASDKRDKQNVRNKIMIKIMFRHALRVKETVELTWDQIDFRKKVLHVHRIKNGIDSVHPLQKDIIDQLKIIRESKHKSDYVFYSEKGEKITTRNVRYILEKLRKVANLKFTIHPHMLRHGTGYHLVNNGHNIRAIQSYMGHTSISNTAKYTHLDSKRFEGFW